METFLEISGEKLVVKNILKGLSIQIHAAVWQKGDPMYRGSSKIHKQSGIRINICNKITFKQQLIEIDKFLKKYKNEIITLRSNPTVEMAIIRFGVNWLEGTDISKLSYLPNEFMLLCGQLRLDVLLCEYLTR
jgi:nitrate reductase beta subunit